MHGCEPSLAWPGAPAPPSSSARAPGQAWRGGTRQAPLAALVASRDCTVDVVDELTARAAGVLCRRAHASDIVDATVVLSPSYIEQRLLRATPTIFAAWIPLPAWSGFRRCSHSSRPRQRPAGEHGAGQVRPRAPSGA